MPVLSNLAARGRSLAASGRAIVGSSSPALSEISDMGRAIVGPGGSTRRKVAGSVILGGLFLAGLGKTLGRGMTDAAMDLAFDDPDADLKMLGTKLTPTMMLGVLYPDKANPAAVGVGGFGGGGIGATAGAMLGRRFGRAGMLAGGTIGGIAGLTLGATTGSLATGGVGSLARAQHPTRFPADTFGDAVDIGYTTMTLGMLTGGIAGGAIGARGPRFGGGRRGLALGAISGVAYGGLAGAAAGGLFVGGSIATTNQARKANMQIINESPFYNSSLLTAERLNARGDIVFGAHNTRRGGY